MKLKNKWLFPHRAAGIDPRLQSDVDELPEPPIFGNTQNGSTALLEGRPDEFERGMVRAIDAKNAAQKKDFAEIFREAIKEDRLLAMRMEKKKPQRKVRPLAPEPPILPTIIPCLYITPTLAKKHIFFTCPRCDWYQNPIPERIEDEEQMTELLESLRDTAGHSRRRSVLIKLNCRHCGAELKIERSL
ncbi:MAG: hypothetical protein ACE5JU_09970 [Candidatus Binatia bacterium]